MKKIAGIVTVIAAFALVVCLAGCSSGMVKLDKSIKIDGLTCTVSSAWEEDNREYDFITNDIFTDPNNPNFSTVTISSWTTNLDKTAKQEFDDDIDSLKKTAIAITQILKPLN